MRYEARIAHEIGPAARSTLRCTHGPRRLQSTRLTITCREPVPIVELVHLLARLGAEIEEIHLRVNGSNP